MAKVAIKVREVPVPATSHPEINVYLDGSEENVGTQSHRSWDHKSVVAGLRTMFLVQPHEEISSITIDERGITARFRSRRG